MNRALTTSSKYSPGNMAVEALETLFVVRDDLLDLTLSAIADTARSVATRYLLLVGPRGAGKTHFTSLLHHQLSAGPKYEDVRERSVIAYFNEEEWGIASYLDFLIRILVVLDEQSNGKLDSQLRDIRKLFSQSETKAISAAEDALTEFVGGKRLILICENLNDLLEGLGTKGQQQWRSFTQQNPFWIVFATSPRISADIQSQKAPFYGQFTIRYLERLRFEDAVELLVRKSTLDRKFELAEFLNTATGRARVRAIHHLAGGNPRVYIVLSEFLTRESLDDLFEPFMQMADDLTPYYQDRLRQLAPRQRKIVEHLSRLSRPAKIKDIAEVCLLTQQTASKQIHELAKQGYVLRIKAGRNTYVELTEPLMRICVEIKDNRTKHLRLFVEFLRHWFSAREIKKGADWGKCMCTRGEVLMQLERYADVIQNEEEHLQAEPDHLHSIFSKSLAYERLGEFEKASQEAEQLVERAPDEPLSWARLAFCLLRLGREQDAMDAINQITIDESSPARWHITKAEILDSIGRKKDAIEVYRNYLEINPTSAETLCMLSQTLVDAGEYKQSVDFSKRLLALEPDHTHAYLDLTRSYLELGRNDEAVAFVHKLSEFSDKHSAKYLSYAANLLAEDGFYDDAIFAINAALEIDSEEIDFLVIKAAILLANNNAKEAISLLNSVRISVASDQRINNLWLAAHVSNSGFDGLSGALSELRKDGKADLASLSWTGLFVELLDQQYQEGGPSGIATSVSRFLESVPVDGIDEYIAEALTEFCFDGLGVEVFAAEGWDRALPLLKESLSDFESCNVALDFLSVAIEYSSGRDEEVLLQLPVEQRELLLTAFNGQKTD